MWQAGEEVIWITSSGGYVNFEFLKITAPIVFKQRFEPGPLDLKDSALPLRQDGTCMSKVGTM